MVAVSTDFNSLKVFFVEKGVTSLQFKDSLNISTLEPIDSFDIHKSLNYVLVTTKDGCIHVFGLKTKEFIFKFALEMRVKSRLYFLHFRLLLRSQWVIHSCRRDISKAHKAKLLCQL